MRLITRPDLDGIVCGSFLREIDVVEEILFAHPKEVQDNEIPVTDRDILANVPFVKGCGYWFDHHASEEERVRIDGSYQGSSHGSPSAARLVFNYYNSPLLRRFEKMLIYIDRIDSADVTEKDILTPEGWMLLGHICDPRTGIERSHSFSIDELQMKNELVENIRKKKIEEILELPDIKSRVERYFVLNEQHKEFMLENSYIDGNVIITDLRNKEEIPPGNRYLIYSLFPKANISVRILEGELRDYVTISVGYSVINRTCKINVGALLLKYGGGGHRQVGTCQTTQEKANKIISEIIELIKA